jgi:indolepyruvate decarboxylase
MTSIERREAMTKVPLCNSSKESSDKALTNAFFFKTLGSWLHSQPVPVTILADTGDSLFASCDMALRPHDKFITQAFYCSIGYTVPAAVGAAHANQTARESTLGAIDSGFGIPNDSQPSAEQVRTPEMHCMPSRRLFCLVGDGAFQMTATELSTAIRDNLPITYIVLNNGGYGIERAVSARA